MEADRILIIALARVRTDPELGTARLLAAADAVRAELAITDDARVLAPDAGTSRSSAHTLSNGVGVGEIDAVIELAAPASIDREHLVQALGDALGAVHDDVDPAHSTMVIGPEHGIIEGHSPVELVYCMRRNASVTHDEFRAAWVEHGELARHTPGVVGYRQLHCDLDITQRANAAAGFDATEIDGVALLCFANEASFTGAQSASTEFSQRAKASEAAFNDPTRALAVLTRARG